MTAPTRGPLNVTIVLPAALRSAVENRREVRLGLPTGAGVADVLETLLRLYPKLTAHVTSDRRGAGPGFTLFLEERASRELASRQSGLREGSRLYLSAALPRTERVLQG